MIKAKEILSKQCNRYVNGLCTTAECLKRAGWNRFQCNTIEEYDKCIEKATCEYHEAILEIDSLLYKKNE